MRLLHEDITQLVIRAFYNVYNKLGYGFLEKVYEKALLLELRKLGLEALPQYAIKVFYDESEVGNYFADIIVNKKVIIELKACKSILEEHEAQTLNYLKATEMEVGLLLNFGTKPQFKRLIFLNKNK